MTASSKKTSNDLGSNAQVKAQPKSASKDPSNVADHLRTADCLFSDAQLADVKKNAEGADKHRLDVLDGSKASHSTRPQIRQHASNEWAEQGGVKQAQKPKVGNNFTI